MFKNKKNLEKINYDQQGFSLLLVVLILAAMLGTTLIVSTIVLEVGRTLAKVPHSEVALYAAEAGAEKALYEINKNYANVNEFNIEESDLSENGDLEIFGSKFVIDHSDRDVEVIRKNVDGTLDDRSSFELDYDLNGVVYGNLILDFSSEIIISVLKINPEDSTMDEIYSGTSNHFDLIIETGNLYKVRVYNNSGSNVVFTIRQGEGDICSIDENAPESELVNCPIVGVKIISHGRYKNTERVVEVDDLKWHRF